MVEFSWLRYTIRTSTHGHGCSVKKLDTRQSKNHQYSVHSITTKNLSRVFPFFELWSETQSEFLQCFGLICINCTNFVWLTLTGTIFPKLHIRQRCRCKNCKRFSNFRPPHLPRQRSANSYKTLERSVTKVRHRELWTFGPVCKERGLP